MIKFKEEGVTFFKFTKEEEKRAKKHIPKFLRPKNKKTTLGKLAENFREWMGTDIDSKVKAKGFRIGKGTKLYWYITPMPETGKYRCFPVEDDGKLGYPVYHYPEKEVTIVY